MKTKYLLTVLSVIAVSGIVLATTYGDCANIAKILVDDPDYADYETILDDYRICRQSVTTTTTTLPPTPDTFFRSYQELDGLVHTFNGNHNELDAVLENACNNVATDLNLVRTYYRSDVDNMKFKCTYSAINPRGYKYYSTFWSLNYYPSYYYRYCAIIDTQQYVYDLVCNSQTIYSQYFKNSNTMFPWVVE